MHRGRLLELKLNINGNNNLIMSFIKPTRPCLSIEIDEYLNYIPDIYRTKNAFKPSTVIEPKDINYREMQSKTVSSM